MKRRHKGQEMKVKDYIKCKIKDIFSINNMRKMFFFMLYVFIAYGLFLLFSPLLPEVIQDKISRISGFCVIVIMLILLFLLFYSLKLINNFILKLGLVGSIGTIIMYSLWLTIDYGSKHPYASATGFNISEMTLGLACSYLLLDKLITYTKNNKK